jgi:hypothetical protein
MAQQNLKVKSGNRHVVMLDGNVVGMAQSVDMSDSYSLESASGIGDIHVQEHVPTMATHSINIEEMVLRLGNLRTLGLTFENGDDALRGVVFDILTVDKDSGATLRKYIGCSYDSGSVHVRKHAIIVSSAVFKALDVSGKGA